MLEWAIILINIIKWAKIINNDFNQARFPLISPNSLPLNIMLSMQIVVFVWSFWSPQIYYSGIS